MSLDSKPATLHPDHHILRLEGELDLAREPLMRADLESRLREHLQVVIDLTAVTFVDCTALGTLVWARTRAQEVGGDVTLLGPCPALSRILRLTSLDGELVLSHSSAG